MAKTYRETYTEYLDEAIVELGKHAIAREVIPLLSTWRMKVAEDKK